MKSYVRILYFAILPLLELDWRGNDYIGINEPLGDILTIPASLAWGLSVRYEQSNFLRKNGQKENNIFIERRYIHFS